jgi:DNA-binding response OmpR family regulator
MARILIVEDEIKIAEVVKAYLKKEGHSAIAENNGKTALNRFLNEEFDLVILDLMLPGLSGEEVCIGIRNVSKVPVLMLTAKADEASLLYGFRVGADDYLTKPFSPRELVVRVRAILRRAGTGSAEENLLFGEGLYRIEVKVKKLFHNDIHVHLTNIEYDILLLLVTHQRRIFSREEIIVKAFEDDFRGMERTVDSHIRNLRGKIERDSKNPEYILTERGRGFYFNG